MSNLIIKLHNPKTGNDNYIMWSTITDSPIWYGCSLEEFKRTYLAEYGTAGMSKLTDRLERVEETGCSGFLETLDGLIETNHAGPSESCLTKDELIEEYCKY